MTKNSSAVLPCFLAGLATGAVLAVLLAPNSGASTRGLIGRKVSEGRDLLKSQVAAGEDFVRTRGAEMKERFKGAAEHLAGDAPGHSA